MTAAVPLTRAQMEVLEFERATWRYQGRRDAVILERFGHMPTRHTQVLLHIINLPAAAAYDPVLVRQLRAQQDQRRAARAGRGRGFEVPR